MKYIKVLFSLFVLLHVNFAKADSILEIKIEGPITPATDDFLKDALRKAKHDKANLLLLHLNTPGGLLPSMQKMVENMLQSEVPVVVYVNPQGGGAISAGVFITLAAHVAVMAPGTTIGAAHPVQGGGQDIGKDMRAKMENFTISLITAIAEQRGRNIDWAKKAVKESVSITDKEAVEIKVVDFVAKDTSELLSKLNGRKINLAGKEVTLGDLSNLPRTELEMNLRQRVVALLSDPNVSVLLSLGAMAGLGIEMYHPGLIFPGVFGLICLILALTSAQVLPINTGGLLLILLSAAFFMLEMFFPSFGIWGVAGIVCLVLGAIYYIDPSNIWTGDGFGVDFYMIGSVAAFIGLLLTAVAIVAYKVRTKKVSTGAEGLLGKKAIVKKAFTIDANNKLLHGKIEIGGEIWSAVLDSTENFPQIGQEVEVVKMQPGLKLLVKII